MSCKASRAFLQYMEKWPQRMRGWLASLRPRRRAWWTGLRVQWCAPLPWYRRPVASIRYFFWWGMPFGWRMVWRWVGRRVPDFFYQFIADVLLNFVPLLPVVILGLVTLVWVYEKEMGNLRDWVAWAGVFATTIGLFLQYWYHHKRRQQAEQLRARWRTQAADWLLSTRNSVNELVGVLSAWLRLPRALQQKYPLMDVEEEDVWFYLMGNLVQRFVSVHHGEVFFQPDGLGRLWAYLASRYPTTPLWDLALLLEEGYARRLCLRWTILKNYWKKILADETKWPRQYALLSWLVARMDELRHQQNTQEDWLENFKILLADFSSIEEQEKRDFFMSIRRNERLRRSEWSHLALCYTSCNETKETFGDDALYLLFDMIVDGKVWNEDGKAGIFVWSSTIAGDRRWFWDLIRSRLLHRGNALAIWRARSFDVERGAVLHEWLETLAYAWAEWLRCRPEYFFELLPQRQDMLLDLLFTVWRTPSKVQEAIYARHDVEWRRFLSNLLLERIAAYPFSFIEPTRARLTRWLHLKPPGTGALLLMVSADCALPPAAMQPTWWAWLRANGISLLAVVAPEHLPDSIPPDLATAVQQRPIRWKAQDILEAWNRQWRQAYGSSVAQEIPWTDFFPPEERARLKRWEKEALWYAQGSWSRFVEFMRRQARQLDRDTQSKLLDDERKRRIFGL